MQRPHNLKGVALALWGLQMCLNTLWTPVFFGAFDLPGALVLIAMLWVVIGTYSSVSFSIDRKRWISLFALLGVGLLRYNS